MSLKLNERYPLRFNNPSAQYPQGSFKNRSAPNAKDGSYLEQDWANDKEGFFQRLLVAAGIAPNGLVDTAENSQYFDALAEIINSSVSVPDATTLVKGISRFGSIAEQVAGLSNTIMTNPAGVMSLITSLFPKRSFEINDYIRIPDVPGGLIIQWQSIEHSGGKGVSRSFNYPTPFPSVALAKAALDASTVASRPVIWSNSSALDTLSTFSMHWTFGDVTSSNVTRQCFVVSIGF